VEDHLSEDELKGYGGRAMPAGALLDADRHLAECTACRRQLRLSVPAPGLPAEVLDMAEPLHLTYEQMAAHVDASLSGDELSAVENHRAICRRCDRELAELHSFNARMAAEFAFVASDAAPRAGWLKAVGAAVAGFFANPARLRFAGAGFALIFVGVFTLLQSGKGAVGNGAAIHMTANSVAASAAMHPHLFYGGFVVAACGLCALLYGVFKR
jgi:anti-sigma factor RsiW